MRTLKILGLLILLGGGFYLGNKYPMLNLKEEAPATDDFTESTDLLSDESQSLHSKKREIAPQTVLTTSEDATIRLFESSAPSVCFITTSTLREDFWNRNVMEIPSGTGSGFIWDNDGHIITNFHVIQNASKIKVT